MDRGSSSRVDRAVLDSRVRRRTRRRTRARALKREIEPLAFAGGGLFLFYSPRGGAGGRETELSDRDRGRTPLGSVARAREHLDPGPGPESMCATLGEEPQAQSIVH